MLLSGWGGNSIKLGEDAHCLALPPATITLCYTGGYNDDPDKGLISMTQQPINIQFHKHKYTLFMATAVRPIFSPIRISHHTQDHRMLDLYDS
jgi:hypothetical protein